MGHAPARARRAAALATLLEGQDRLARAQSGVRQMLVVLYKALGGGWDAADPRIAARTGDRKGG